LFGEVRHLRCGGLVVARQEHDAAAAVDARVGGQRPRGQMVEALHEAGAGEGLGDVGGRQSLETVHRVHDRLALPARQRLGDLAMSLEENGQENHVRLERFLQRRGNDLGSDRLRLRQQGLGRPPTGDGDFDVVAGESAGEGLADGAETDDGVAHGDGPFQYGVGVGWPVRAGCPIHLGRLTHQTN
jgi:hypothetical protein